MGDRDCILCCEFLHGQRYILFCLTWREYASPCRPFRPFSRAQTCSRVSCKLSFVLITKSALRRFSSSGVCLAKMAASFSAAAAAAAAPDVCAFPWVPALPYQSAGVQSCEGLPHTCCHARPAQHALSLHLDRGADHRHRIHLHA